MVDVLMADLLKQKISLALRLKNLTSGVAFAPGSRILSLGERSCLLDLPPRSCSLGHRIQICFTLENHVHRRDIEVIGKVEEISSLEEGRQEVTMVFHQFLSEEWQLILDCIEGKQNDINAILETLRLG